MNIEGRNGMTEEAVAVAKQRRALVVAMREREVPATFQEIGDALGVLRCRAYQLYKSEVKKRSA